MKNLQRIFDETVKHPLFSGSIVMVLGNNLFSLGQFIYHFLAIRLLKTSDYGDLAAIISILSIIGIIQLAFGLTIVKFVASAETKAIVSNLIKWFNYWGLSAGVIAALILLLLSPFVSNFLNLTQPNIVYLFSPILFISIIVYIHRSILQGLMLFKNYIVSLIIEVVVKIIITVLLVTLGMALFGAMIGVLIGILGGFIITWLSLKSYFSGKREEKPEVLPLLKYSFPVFLQGMAFTSMFSTDILLVKHFFSPHEAGTYAYLSVLGRIAMYCSAPITSTMFPIIANRFVNKKPYLRIFYLCLFLITGSSLFVVSIFWLVPDIPISLLGKSEGGEILWWFGLFMTLLGISLLLIQFYFSINETKPVWFFVGAAILQAVLIWFIHPNLLSVVQVSIASTALLIIALFVYFPYCKHYGEN